MSNKIHKTAAVIIPPDEIWPLIQNIRHKHDKQIRLWMPHITLLYPFRPREAFDAMAHRFLEELEDIEPFLLELREFGLFRHRGHSCTLWLTPEPREPLDRLQSVLMAVLPDCDDVVRFSGRFMPHMSVGQTKGVKSTNDLLNDLQGNWEPISFRVSELCLIWRKDPPDDIFRIDQRIPLKSGVVANPS